MIVKALRFLLRKKTIIPLMLFVVGIYISSTIVANIQVTRQQKLGEIKYNQFYNIDQAPNKPEDELIVYPDQASIYNPQGEKFGELMNTPLVYSTNSNGIFKDSLIYIRIYGWAWKESLDSDNKLNVPENIRYRSNSHIIARLKSGTQLDTIYTNELKTLTLITFTCFVPKNCLLTSEKFGDIPGVKKFFSNSSIKTTNTKRTGGVSVKPTTRPIIKFEDFIWPVRLVFSIVIFSSFIWILGKLYIPRGTHDKRIRRINMINLIVSGMVVGCALHWNIFLSIILKQ
jgi:hypothetical protein